ncbi:MAG TPA: hypothetical protein PLE30_07205 [Candidatus Kapabacteria bacterium]|nr:hypothetical protein [Candidatus Kapabacteria bacterium]
MADIIIIVVGYVIALIHFFFLNKDRSKAKLIDILFVYSLVFQVGGIGVFLGFVPHVFFADKVAIGIGWPTGSPFQKEVGIHDGVWGLLGFLCIKYKNGFRAATAIGWALFMFGAAVGHVVQSINEGNFAEYNFLMIFVDFFVAFALPALLYLSYKNPLEK